MTGIADIRAYLDGLLDASVPNRPAWNQELLLGHQEPAWNYVDGCMILAVLEMYGITGDDRYLRFADDFIDYYVAEDGKILGYDRETYNCDNINEGKVLFPLYERTGKGKYRLAIETLYDQLKTHPRTPGGSFWHKKIYPNQIWLDGLYMVQPFYLQYDRTFGGRQNYRDAFTQLHRVWRLMQDEKTGLLYHGCDESKQAFWADPLTGCSKNFWSRGIGWYAMALVDSAQQMDEQFFYEYNTLQEDLRELLDALLRHADPETGLLWQVTDQGGRPGNYLETSASCAVAYALMKGARLGFLPEFYFAYGEGMLRSVMEHKLERREGTLVLKDICLVAGLGVYPGKGSYKERDGSYEYYISEPRVENDAKGVAPFLLAFTELYRKEVTP